MPRLSEAEIEMITNNSVMVHLLPYDAVTGEILALRKELAAYKKAKSENDERFMIERDEARRERDCMGAALSSVVKEGRRRGMHIPARHEEMIELGDRVRKNGMLLLEQRLDKAATIIANLEEELQKVKQERDNLDASNELGAAGAQRLREEIVELKKKLDLMTPAGLRKP